ncbi:hypothetical protein ULMS_00390 [Patiriisocius marinistellae]|uniref:Uncharacterized protein n=1 Tax=Patiriisocius marinistellae TaxID=2494560 RepID=A0A5J4FXX9_9FLAO|nr:hypothetical protein [Patiriisocius marinistellae]GEQ84531.1 hypothetical protein ULMS_00390 [Patiriisocius marinistellae]
MDKKEQIKKENTPDKAESLNPKTEKGPQKEKHQNQYGDKDKATRVQ